MVTLNISLPHRSITATKIDLSHSLLSDGSISCAGVYQYIYTSFYAFLLDCFCLSVCVCLSFTFLPIILPCDLDLSIKLMVYIRNNFRCRTNLRWFRALQAKFFFQLCTCFWRWRKCNHVILRIFFSIYCSFNNKSSHCYCVQVKSFILTEWSSRLHLVSPNLFQERQ